MIAILNAEDRTISGLSLGDSGYLILRPSNQKLVKLYRSKEQQHYFDCPYQCGTGSKIGDRPARAAVMEHEVQNGDIIVMATDGVWDNCFDYEIEEISTFLIIILFSNIVKHLKII